MSPFQQVTLLTCLSGLVVSGAASVRAEEQNVTFTRDIMPMLTKLGCNTVNCHDILRGKGGLKLSPLGSDPQHDFNALARADAARRVSPIDPDHSLLLKRLSGATSTVRLKPDSEAYRTFYAWMAAGALGPSDSDPHVVKLTATPARVVLQKGQSRSVEIHAQWSDGVVRDVTRWCRFEIDKHGNASAEVSDTGVVSSREHGRTIVRVRFLKNVASVDVLTGFETAQADWAWQPHNVIDEIVAGTWRDVGVAPNRLSSDHVFLRRAYLQIIGRIPSEETVHDFMASTRETRRSELIDKLLARSEFADHWANVWTDWLLEDRRVDWLSVPRSLQVQADRQRLHAWLSTKFADERAVPTIVREILTATGSTIENGAAAFYSGHRTHDDMARSFGQVFLGASFRCARCHDHPHGEWGTDDFDGIASAFQGVSVRMKKDRPLTVQFTPNTSLKETRTQRRLPHVSGVPLHTKGQDSRESLADWLLDDGRLMLARNVAHRYWSQFHGLPLTQWVDDLTPSSAERHPELLDTLARELIEHDFDTRHLIRMICESRTYQLDSKPPGKHADIWFNSRFASIRIPDRELMRAIRTAAGSRLEIEKSAPVRRVKALEESAVECSRGEYRQLNYMYSSLHLIGSEKLMNAIHDPDGIVQRLIASDASTEDIARRLFLRILNRQPTQAEWKSVDDHFRKADRTQFVQDVFWALVNTREFVFIQ